MYGTCTKMTLCLIYYFLIDVNKNVTDNATKLKCMQGRELRYISPLTGQSTNRSVCLTPYLNQSFKGVLQEKKRACFLRGDLTIVVKSPYNFKQNKCFCDFHFGLHCL